MLSWKRFVSLIRITYIKTYQRGHTIKLGPGPWTLTPDPISDPKTDLESDPNSDPNLKKSGPNLKKSDPNLKKSDGTQDTNVPC